MEAFEDFEIVEPSPASIVESLRAIGYSLETAIADLIDNSITAGASLICIDSPYNGVDTKLFLLDNGSGMNNVMNIWGNNNLLPGDQGRLNIAHYSFSVYFVKGS